jgi:hypothetical protein
MNQAEKQRVIEEQSLAVQAGKHFASVNLSQAMDAQRWRAFLDLSHAYGEVTKTVKVIGSTICVSGSVDELLSFVTMMDHEADRMGNAILQRHAVQLRKIFQCMSSHPVVAPRAVVPPQTAVPSLDRTLN